MFGNTNQPMEIRVRCSHFFAPMPEVIREDGARCALIPIGNIRHFLEVPADIVERVDPIFYGEPFVAARKALGLK